MRNPLVNPRTAFGSAWIVLVLLYLYAPVAVIVIFSFTTSPRLSLPIEGFTLNWYAQALENPLVPIAIRNTAILALFSSSASCLIGTLFAFGLVQLHQPRIRGVLLSSSLLPAIVPLLVIGISLAVFFKILGMHQGLLGAAIGHVLVSLPFVILTMNARLETFDFTILEAARDLGATRARAFRDITFPLIRPSVIGASLLAAALSLDEFVVTWFNIGNQQTLPVLIWGLMRRGIDPSINSIATILMTVLILLVVTSHLLDRKSFK